MAEAFEGPVKVLVKKRWVSGYGRAAAGALVVSESVLGGAVLGQASLAEPARRGLPADAPPPPPGEENCQFALGAALVLSAPSFAASSDWMAALKSHSPAVSSARAQVLRSASASSLSSAASSSSSSLSLSEPVSLPAAVAALLGTASSGSSGAAECARVARPVQSLAMSELKRFKALLQQQPRETAASRHLEAAVAELAGLLKELVGALRMYAETEDLPEKQRLKQLTRDVGDAHARALAREEGLRQGVGKASSSSLPAARPRSALDEAVETLVAAASSGPKEAVAATKQVQSLAMAQLRAAKQLADSSPSERERVEPEVAACASTLKELVGAVRVLARDGLDEQLAETERLARQLQSQCASLGVLLEKSASGPAKSPRGPSLSMEQLLALARSSSSSEEPSSNAASSSSLLQLSSESALPVALSPRPPDEQQEQDAQEQDALERVAAALRDETHRALARQLASAVRELAVWTRARQQQHEGEEEEAEEASRRVRGPLCSALAQILAYRFKVGTSWLGSWGGPQHFWQFIMDFSANSSVNTVAGLSLQKCLKQLAADPKAGHDDNSRFRSFVVVALNQGKLARWLGEMTDPGHAGLAARFYEGGAFLADKEARAALLELLRPLEKTRWNMDVHYEHILRQRKKEQH